MRLERYQGNPILKPVPENKWESGAVFNCAAAYDGSRVHLLYRAIGEYDVYISRLGYAVSQDGFTFQRRKEPVLQPEEEYERFGCEDPRMTVIDGTYYVTYTALSNRAWSGSGNRVALAKTTDFKTFHKLGIILPGMEDKNAVLFPEKVNGKYVMYHRIVPDIWIAYSDNLLDWTGHKVVMQPRKGMWDDVKIGAGGPPLKTEKGWLLFYHGVDENRVYRLGVALFDLENPARLVARQESPILEPEETWEKEGDIPNVVFTCGAVEKEGRYLVYYGGADTVVGVATVDVEKALDFVPA
jgi:predicted GH43/DUF377 family glycosyl hydrolase